MKKFAVMMMMTIAFGAAQGQQQAASAPEDKQRQIALTQAQIDKFQAQAMLLQQTLNGLTEFRQWVSIQQQFAQAQQELQRLNAPENKSAGNEKK
jgi:uncharacterized protein YlxW (UPF0749 family)